MIKGQTARVLGLSFALAAVLAVESIASASSVTGRIVDIRVSPGINSGDRVSILMSNTTACSNAGWYAFENADTGLGKSWLDALLLALNSGKQISIVGTGTCDSAGVEEISFIDFKPV